MRRLVVVLGLLCVAAGPDAGVRVGPKPTRVTRALSDAWYYNKLKRTLLETQIRAWQEQLATLDAKKNEIATTLKAEFQVDVLAGDEWEEGSLEIRRKGGP